MEIKALYDTEINRERFKDFINKWIAVSYKPLPCDN